MDLKSHACHLHGPKLYIDKIKELVGCLINSIWTCVGPKSRLSLKKLLDSKYYLLCVKV